MSKQYPPRVWISQEEIDELVRGGRPAEASLNEQIIDDIPFVPEALVKEAVELLRLSLDADFGVLSDTRRKIQVFIESQKEKP